MPFSPKDILELYKKLGGPQWESLAAQGWVESRYRTDRISPAGAAGVAQFMPTTWRWAIAKGWVAATAKPTEPEAAIAAQRLYMDWLRDQVATTPAALAAYNWGVGHVSAVIVDFGAEWDRHLPRETWAYIREVAAVRDWLTTGGLSV
jgi:soluble lytic murein transglycosylase-like protein